MRCDRPKSDNKFYVNFSDNSCLHPSGLFDKLLVMADRTGDPVGAPLAGAQDETMTDRTGDPVGAPLAGAPNDTAGKGL